MSSIVIQGDTSGAITVAAPSVAGTNTLTLPASTGTIATTADVSALTTGKILQVIQVYKTSVSSFTSAYSTWTSIPGMSITITPSSTSSKILLMVTLHGTTPNLSYMRISRGGTILPVGDAAGSRIRCMAGAIGQSGDANNLHTWNINYLDSPSTTSATTYTLEITNQTSNTFYINRSVTDSDSTAGGRPISTIIAMEVA